MQKMIKDKQLFLFAIRYPLVAEMFDREQRNFVLHL